MQHQVITTPSGERLVVLPESDYRALVEAAEDAADRTAADAFARRLAAGEEEFVPSEVLERLLAGENRVRVWREHRGLSVSALAERAGIAQAFLSQIETGKREGRVETLKQLARALSLTIDDLVD
jgi:DNA-binding Xre family transcriptional regulator